MLDVWFIHLHHEDTKNSLNCFLICKSVTCGGTLCANILKSLASIKPDNLIRLLLIKTLDYDINSIITEFPNWVCHFIIKLRGSIEHVLPKSCNSSSSDLLIAVSERVNQLTGYVNLCKLIIDNSRVPN